MKKIITTLVLLITLCGNAQEFKSNYNKGKYVVPLPDRREWMIQADGSEFKYFKLNSKEYKESTEELLAILENYKSKRFKAE